MAWSSLFFFRCLSVKIIMIIILINWLLSYCYFDRGCNYLLIIISIMFIIITIIDIFIVIIIINMITFEARLILSA